MTESDQYGFKSDKKISTEQSPNRPNPQKYKAEILVPDSLEEFHQFESLDQQVEEEINKQNPALGRDGISQNLTGENIRGFVSKVKSQ